jgi:hypothetical protein
MRDVKGKRLFQTKISKVTKIVAFITTITALAAPVAAVEPDPWNGKLQLDSDSIYVDYLDGNGIFSDTTHLNAWKKVLPDQYNMTM